MTPWASLVSGGEPSLDKGQDGEKMTKMMAMTMKMGISSIVKSRQLGCSAGHS